MALFPKFWLPKMSENFLDVGKFSPKTNNNSGPKNFHLKKKIKNKIKILSTHSPKICRLSVNRPSAEKSE